MAWVREKNPKRKVSAAPPQRDPREAIEGFLSYLACKPSPPPNLQHYLRHARDSSPPRPPTLIEQQHHHHHHKPEIVPREPTIYSAADNDNEEINLIPDVEASLIDEDDEDYDPPALQNRRKRRDHHHHQQSSRAAPSEYHRSQAGGGAGATPSLLAAAVGPPRHRTTTHTQQRHVSNVMESRPYRPRTSVQERRVVSSWSNATTALVI